MVIVHCFRSQVEVGLRSWLNVMVKGHGLRSRVKITVSRDNDALRSRLVEVSVKAI